MKSEELRSFCDNDLLHVSALIQQAGALAETIGAYIDISHKITDNNAYNSVCGLAQFIRNAESELDNAINRLSDYAT